MNVRQTLEVVAESSEDDIDPYDRLFELFDWSNRESTYRVHFTDRFVYELTGLGAARDPGVLPHGTVRVVREVRRVCDKTWSLQSAMFFQLADLEQVADLVTGEILYQMSNEEL